MTENDYKKVITSYLKIMRLWHKEGYVWYQYGPFLYFDSLIPGDAEHDCRIAIDMEDYSYACFNPNVITNGSFISMVISEKEHKLISKTINIIKKLKEVKNEEKH